MDAFDIMLMAGMFTGWGLYAALEYRDYRAQKRKLKDADKQWSEGNLGEAYRLACDLRRGCKGVRKEANNLIESIENLLTPDINMEINLAWRQLGSMKMKISPDHGLRHCKHYVFVDHEDQHLRLEDLSPTYKKYFGSENNDKDHEVKRECH